MSGSGISWAICKSAPRSRQITMPAPHHSVFYRPNALLSTQPTSSKHWRQTTTSTKPGQIKLCMSIHSISTLISYLMAFSSWLLVWCLTAQKLLWLVWSTLDWFQPFMEVAWVHLRQLVLVTCIMSRSEKFLDEALHCLGTVSRQGSDSRLSISAHAIWLCAGMLRPRGPCGLEAKSFGLSLGLTFRPRPRSWPHGIWPWPHRNWPRIFTVHMTLINFTI